jgi:superfamily II DNA or RNA helicase
LRELFNKMVVGPSVKELVAAGYLVPAVTYGPAVAPDLSQVKTRGGDYAPEGLEALMAQSVLIGDVVQYYRKFAAGRRALYYCISIEHSRQVAAAFCAAGFRAGHVDGDSGDKERERAIAGLADGSLDVLTNVLLFSEGLDIPPLEAVGILRPTKSSGLHRQMNGRPLRPAPGKKNAIIIDHSGNSFRHGLYDYEPRWSLEGRRREESEAEGEAPVQCCPNAECGALIASSARHCPHCGTVLARRGRVPQQTSGQLEQINEDHQLKLMLQYMPYRRAVEWAEGDYDRLAYVGRVRGYKPGWAYYQWCDAKGDNPCWGRSTLRRSASMSSCCTGSLRR